MYFTRQYSDKFNDDFAMHFAVEFDNEKKIENRSSMVKLEARV